METLITSSNSKVFFGMPLSPPRFRCTSHFTSPHSSRNVCSLRCISLQRNAIQFDSPTSNQLYPEAWTRSGSAMQGSHPLKTVRVRFQLHKECSFGEKFVFVGDQPVIGCWDPSRGMSMNWSDGHMWTVEMDTPVDLAIQFKFVLQQKDGELCWQPGADRIIKTWDTRKTVVVEEDWEKAELQKIMEEEVEKNQVRNIGLMTISGDVDMKPNETNNGQCMMSDA